MTAHTEGQAPKCMLDFALAHLIELEASVYTQELLCRKLPLLHPLLVVGVLS